MTNPPQDTGIHNLQRYYASSQEDYKALQRKDFTSWYPKYYSQLKTDSSGLILDVGCGTGQVVHRFTQEGYTAFGVDISPLNLQKAKENGGDSFILASAHHLPFRDGSFQAVGGYDFLEHTHHPRACLEEMVRVLKSKGRIVVTSPNFLKVIGLQRDYHWHMQGLRQKTSNLHTLLRKLVSAKTRTQRVVFEFMQPKSDRTGGDVDAVCVINPVDVKAVLEGLGIQVTYQSASSTFHPNRVVEALSEVPLLRSITGGFIITGTKQRQEVDEKYKIIDGLSTS